MTIELVIFDCDGVLVDSEPISNRVWCEQLRAIGWPHDDDHSHALFVGRHMADCVRIVEKEIGARIPPDFIARFRERSFEAFRRELRPVPGVPELLASLALPRCVASSGPHEKIRLNLSITGLLAHFEHAHLFSADDVSRGKPHPDLFLHAAERLHHAPERCLVVEDSRAGVEAALAAGMRVAHFLPGDSPPIFPEARVRMLRCMGDLNELARA